MARGRPNAVLEVERRRARATPGTTVFIGDLDPDVLRVLTQRKVVDYLRRRRGPALARGDYEIEVLEGRRSELVTPEEPDGVRLAVPARQTLWGRIEFHLWVSPHPDRRRRVAVAGAGGVTIIDDLSDIEEFDGPPWSSDQVTGVISFDALQQTAGRRAVLRDRDAFPVFLEAVRSVEPLVARTLERIAREVDLDVAGRLNDAVRRIFGRVLKELSDLENPMRTQIGPALGEGGLLEVPEAGVSAETPGAEPPGRETGDEDLLPPPTDPIEPAAEIPRGGGGGGRSKDLPSIAPDPAAPRPRRRSTLGSPPPSKPSHRRLYVLHLWRNTSIVAPHSARSESITSSGHRQL